ncbi:hypothetical protein Droror1_Dr00016253 [Drosera rotundifolia]
MPEAITGSKIDIMVEEKVSQIFSKETQKGAPRWFHAEILQLVDVPGSSFAIQSLIGPSSGTSEQSWEVGWSLATRIDDPQKFVDAVKGKDKYPTESVKHLAMTRSVNPYLINKTASRIILLKVPKLSNEGLPKIMISPSNRRGDVLLAMGSPFGVLSPVHFFNSIVVGSISNKYPSTSSDGSLLLADIRCLPGMEGGPIFGEARHLIGLLTRPLKQAGGAEIQLVITWQAIAAALCGRRYDTRPEKASQYADANCDNLMSTEINSPYQGSLPQYIHRQSVDSGALESPLGKAAAAVCLVTMDNGVWASGILLNNHGLILTNAHLLEPWRFGKTTVNSGKDGNPYPPHKESAAVRREKPEKDSGVRQIHVRLDHSNSWVWHNARVIYVCKGPLDVSLLKLDSVPRDVCPITADLSCPSPGSKAFVIGHGLFGPRCEMVSSISSGVIAKVVKAQMPSSYSSNISRNVLGELPAMIETTAAVHPGGSGGAVVNSAGHMVGLVTSNAKHGGGTVIPHMNFSIPCAALEPVFKFSEDMQKLSILEELERPDENLSSVWALMPPLSPEPAPPKHGWHDVLMKEDDEKQEKGSRFTKFIAERPELFKGLGQQPKMAGSLFLDHRSPSKL